MSLSFSKPLRAFLNTNKTKLLVSHTSFLLLLYSSSSGLMVIHRTFHIWYLFKEFSFIVSFYWNILDSDSMWLTSSLYWDFCSNFPIHFHFILIFYCNSYFYLALHHILYHLSVYLCMCVCIHLFIWTLTYTDIHRCVYTCFYLSQKNTCIYVDKYISLCQYRSGQE